MGQALRVLERCSKKEDSEEHLQNLESKLKKRNYPEKLIKTKFSEAKKRNRNSLIHQGRHQKSSDDKKVRLLFTNNRGNPPLHQWFREAKKCLVKDDRAKALGDNFQICYRQPKNLKSIVTHKKKPYSTDDEPGCTKCGKCKVSCPVIVEGGKFTSTNTRKTYPIRKKLNCNSSFLIYLATCKKCRGYQNFSVQLIDQVEEGDKVALANREVYWQNQLRCYVQNGGRAHCRRKEK